MIRNNEFGNSKVKNKEDQRRKFIVLTMYSNVNSIQVDTIFPWYSFFLVSNYGFEYHTFHFLLLLVPAESRKIQSMISNKFLNSLVI